MHESRAETPHTVTHVCGVMSLARPPILLINLFEVQTRSHTKFGSVPPSKLQIRVHFRVFFLQQHSWILAQKQLSFEDDLGPSLRCMEPYLSSLACKPSRLFFPPRDVAALTTVTTPTTGITPNQGLNIFCSCCHCTGNLGEKSVCKINILSASFSRGDEIGCNEPKTTLFFELKKTKLAWFFHLT